MLENLALTKCWRY